MAWKRVIGLLLLVVSVAESSSRPWKAFAQDSDVQLKIFSSWLILSSGIFVMVALVLSLFLIFKHLAVYNKPEEQKFLIGLILMVPVYAVESFLSLLNSKAAFICEIMRDCYEVFALYCFERYLIACLGGEENTIKLMEKQVEISSSMPLLELQYEYEDGVVRHPFPLNILLRHWYLGPDFYHAVKIGIVQYMILKTICALLAIILELLGVYGEGKFGWNYGYPYLAVVLNYFSQTWALYCLIQFYSVTKEKLEPIKPLAKFLTFKSIVFLTWWQGVTIAFLFSTGFFKGHLAQELKTRIQDYIICIEVVYTSFSTAFALFSLCIISRSYLLAKNAIENMRNTARTMRRHDNKVVPYNCICLMNGSYSDRKDTYVDGTSSVLQNETAIVTVAKDETANSSSREMNDCPPCGCMGCRECPPHKTYLDPKMTLYLLDTNVYEDHPFLLQKPLISNVVVPGIVVTEVQRHCEKIAERLWECIMDPGLRVHKFSQDKVRSIHKLRKLKGESLNDFNDRKIVATCSVYQNHLVQFENAGGITFVSNDQACVTLACSRKIRLMKTDEFLDQMFNQDRKSFLEEVYSKHNKIDVKHQNAIASSTPKHEKKKRRRR